MNGKSTGADLAPGLTKDQYARHLRALQIELVKLHRYVIAKKRKLLVIIEGRDCAGKDGTIKRIAAHLSPREVRLVAPGKPSDREETQWYFQRFVGHLPAAQEIVLFNRSWYNRAGVEFIMKFCSAEEREAFLEAAPRFERMLARSQIQLLKYYLDITHQEQARRLRDRRRDPLKQWKISPVDEAAQKYWRAYSEARDTMLTRTHHQDAPWIIVRADDKHQARLNVIRDILRRVSYPKAEARLHRPDGRVACEFSEELITSGWLAR